MIREAQFILPAIDGDNPHIGLQNELTEKFGGFTIQTADGAWRDDNGKVHWDHNYLYTVAADWDNIPEDELSPLIELEFIARRYGSKFDQLSIYFKGPDGVVEFLSPLKD